MDEGWSEAELPEPARRVSERCKACAPRLHREVGPGFREHIYRKLLANALRAEGLRVEEEVWLDVSFEGTTLSRAVRADMIVEGVVLVEIKAAENWHPVFGWQVISYLKASGCPVGLLFDFNVPLLMRTGYRSYVHPTYLTKLPEAP